MCRWPCVTGWWRDGAIGHVGTSRKVLTVEISVDKTKVMGISRRYRLWWIKTDANCGVFQLFGYRHKQIVQEVHRTVTPGLPWHRLHSARWRIVWPANWIYIEGLNQ
jgi:hypothetical protein